jgi:CheY-like chemotaxis protein
MAEHDSDAVPSRPKLVLYVEDDPVSAVLMSAIFDGRPDCVLRIAVDGRSALEAVGERTPDLLMLDINLPDCQGQDLLQRLRKDGGCSKVPAIAVTANTGLSEADLSGFISVVTKPFDVQQLMLVIDRLLYGEP